MKDEVKLRTRIEINTGLDENRVPVEMAWTASDGGGQGECKALMLALWDEMDANTMRIDLWTKTMSIYDMQRFFHQSLLTMGDTYERATGQRELAEEIRSFAKTFAQKAGIMG